MPGLTPESTQPVNPEASRPPATGGPAGHQDPFRAAFLAATVGLAQTDLVTGRFLRVNPRFCELTGYPAEELLGMTFLQLTHPDDRAGSVAALRRMCRDPQARYRQEKRYVRKDGRVLWVEVRASLVHDEAGEPAFTSAVIQDVTERRAAEEEVRRLNEELERRVDERTAELEAAVRDLGKTRERLEVAVRGSQDGIWDWDIETGQVYYSPRWKEMLGYAEDELSDRPEEWERLLHPEDRPLALGRQRDYLDGRSPTYEGEFRMRHKDGSYRWVYSRGAALRGPDGQPYRMSGSHTDVTERKRIELELQKAKEAAEAASRAKGEFLANMSHEIRTPMNGILGMLDLAFDTPLNPEQRELLSVARSSAESLLTVLNDILDFSKIEAGKLDLVREDFSLRDGLSDMLRPLEVRARRKGLRLSHRVRPDVPDALVGDLGRLRQVVVNLVGNALKFTPRGEVVVEVARDAAPAPDAARAWLEASLGASPAPPRSRSTLLYPRGPDGAPQGEVVLRVTVTDTGVGIPADKLGSVFEPFVQADGSAARRHGGTGLGLSISARLVELMGGRIWVRSEVGRGSTFAFTVRCGVQAAPAPAAPPAPAVPAAARPLRVLLAEDNLVNQQVARTMLERAGHKVTVAGNGRAAVAAAREGAFDLVLMDVQMPEMDGLEATAAIRAAEAGTGRHLPILALTAHAMKGDRERCLAAGMDGYLAKPFDPRALWRAVAALVPVAGPQPAAPEQAPAPADEEAPFDRANLLARVGGSVSLARTVAGVFEGEWPRLRGALRDALARDDSAALVRAAHSLKGTLGSLAARESLDAARRLEAAARSGQLGPAAEVMPALEAQVERLRAALAGLAEEGER